MLMNIIFVFGVRVTCSSRRYVEFTRFLVCHSSVTSFVCDVVGCFVVRWALSTCPPVGSGESSWCSVEVTADGM